MASMMLYRLLRQYQGHDLRKLYCMKAWRTSVRCVFPPLWQAVPAECKCGLGRIGHANDTAWPFRSPRPERPLLSCAGGQVVGPVVSGAWPSDGGVDMQDGSGQLGGEIDQLGAAVGAPHRPSFPCPQLAASSPSMSASAMSFLGCPASGQRRISSEAGG
jgi:hypothetical protein